MSLLSLGLLLVVRGLRGSARLFGGLRLLLALLVLLLHDAERPAAGAAGHLLLMLSRLLLALLVLLLMLGSLLLRLRMGPRRGVWPGPRRRPVAGGWRRSRDFAAASSA